MPGTKPNELVKPKFLRYWGRAGMATVKVITQTHVEIDSMGTGIAVSKDEINQLITALREAKRNM